MNAFQVIEKIHTHISKAVQAGRTSCSYEVDSELDSSEIKIITELLNFEDGFKVERAGRILTIDWNVDKVEELIKQVEQWSVNKELHKADSSKQFLKVTEEVGEIAGALARNQKYELKDAIGDVVVTLIILAQQNDMTLEGCLRVAYSEIAYRKGKTINGVFVKESDLNE